MEPRISPFSNAKQLKLSCQLTDNNGDRFSNLPDPVLHHILSSLDIKHVIQTSLLSRRWRYLWTSLSTLNFNAKLFVSPEETPGFNNFVDRVLLLHDGSNIESFRLICHEYSVANRLNSWILVALRQNVQKLCFDISVDEIPPLPSCLFTCKSLTTLMLSTSGREFTNLVLPDSMSLPALKVLHLEAFTLDDESSFHKLFSSCPVLEWLYISDCLVEIFNLNISSPKLKYFRLEICHQGSAFSYVTEGKIKLCAPNLIILVCADYISKDYSLENLSSLESADIHMGREVEDYESELPLEMKELYAQRMMRYLRALHNVKKLTVYALFLEVISRSPELLNNQPMQFLNLRVLELFTWLSTYCIHAIIYLLEISPNIETLLLRIWQKPVKDPPIPIYPYLDEINFDSANTEDYRESGLSLNHLKFVEIDDAIGSVNELKFLEILLKNAMALEKVKVVALPSDEESTVRVSRMIKFSETVLKFPRASSSIAILFFS